ncbi:type 1 fimbrial protein [Escherichia coli]|nr:type 1 fimbrial protein [Escherichia coli]
MKKNIITAMLVAAFGFSAMSANAADGTITFKGNIVDKTCDVAIKNAVGNEIQLGAYAKSKVTNAGDIFAERDVVFELTNCPQALKKVSVLLEGDRDADMSDAFNNQFVDATGTTTAAVGVAVLLKDGAKTIAPGAVTDQKDITDGSASLAYKAQFLATKNVANIVSGGYSTNVSYTLNYE